jgi:hypothetical protein
VPRYFFDLHNDVESLDPEGKELPGFEAAKAGALAEALQMIQAGIADHRKVDLRDHIDVRDESGAVVYVLHFEDAVTVQRGSEILSRPSVAA